MNKERQNRYADFNHETDLDKLFDTPGPDGEHPIEKSLGIELLTPLVNAYKALGVVNTALHEEAVNFVDEFHARAETGGINWSHPIVMKYAKSAIGSYAQINPMAYLQMLRQACDLFTRIEQKGNFFLLFFGEFHLDHGSQTQPYREPRCTAFDLQIGVTVGATNHTATLASEEDVETFICFPCTSYLSVKDHPGVKFGISGITSENKMPSIGNKSMWWPSFWRYCFGMNDHYSTAHVCLIEAGTREEIVLYCHEKNLSKILSQSGYEIGRLIDSIKPAETAVD